MLNSRQEPDQCSSELQGHEQETVLYGSYEDNQNKSVYRWPWQSAPNNKAMTHIILNPSTQKSFKTYN